MAREKDGYRDVLERLDEKFGKCEVIKLNDACAYIGAHRRTLLANPTFPIKNLTEKAVGNRRAVYVVPKVGLARWLCSE